MVEETLAAEAVIARQRSERFGTLPPRILPADMIGAVDTRRPDTRRPDARPATALSLEHERALHTAA